VGTHNRGDGDDSVAQDGGHTPAFDRDMQPVKTRYPLSSIM